MNKFKIIMMLLGTVCSYGAAAQTAKPVFDQATGGTLPTGSKAPDFSLRAINGKLVRLSNYKGKIVVLDVWATWCVPCRAELPVLDSLSQSFKADNVIMIAVCSADSKTNYDTYIHDNQLKFKCSFLFDEQGKSLQANSFRSVYGINGFPTTMVIDKAGIIKGYGFNALEIKLLIQSAL